MTHETNHLPTKFAHDMADAIFQTMQDVTSEQTMEEMHDMREVDWLTLLNRLGKDKVNAVMERLGKSVDEYDSYYHHELCDVPPC